MGKRKAAADICLVDLQQTRIRVWPLFGLNRLVRLEHRKRNGILYCDNVMSVSQSMTVSESNAQSSPYTITYRAPIQGVISEPRINVPNEAPAADRRRFQDEGTQVVFTFTPRNGQTYAIECDMYKAFDVGNRLVQLSIEDDTRVAKYELSLDVSAYLAAGYSVENPHCDCERNVTSGKKNAKTAGTGPSRLTAVDLGTGLLGWSVDNLGGGDRIELAWQVDWRDQTRAFRTVNLEKLGRELSINPRVAKDLHNFVMICHYYVAGFRSLNTIGRGILTDKSVLIRTIDSLEELVGADLFQRTKGKGLIQVTPAREAVLDWWSQFYMRWTPIYPEPYVAKRSGRPRGGRKS